MSKKLCDVSELTEGCAIGVNIEIENVDTSIIVVKYSDDIYAYINRCPHIGVPLEWQPNDFIDSDSGLIRCSTHGALFLPDTGACVSGPCVGDRLQVIDIRIDNDEVHLC